VVKFRNVDTVLSAENTNRSHVQTPVLLSASAPVKLQVCNTDAPKVLSVSSTSVVNVSPRAPQCEVNTTLMTTSIISVSNIPPQVRLCERAVSVVSIPNLLFDSEVVNANDAEGVNADVSNESDEGYKDKMNELAAFVLPLLLVHFFCIALTVSKQRTVQYQGVVADVTANRDDGTIDKCNLDVASKQSHTVRDQGVISDVTTNHDGGATDDSTSKCDHGINVLYSLFKDVFPYSPVQREDPRGVLPAQCDSDQGDAGINYFITKSTKIGNSASTLINLCLCQLQTRVQPAGLSGEAQCNGPGEPPVNGQGVLLSAACDADWGGGIDVKCTVCQDAAFNSKLDLWFCLCTSSNVRKDKESPPTDMVMANCSRARRGVC
jgi:hypothetical protein